MHEKPEDEIKLRKKPCFFFVSFQYRSKWFRFARACDALISRSQFQYDEEETNERKKKREAKPLKEKTPFWICFFLIKWTRLFVLQYK